MHSVVSPLFSVRRAALLFALSSAVLSAQVAPTAVSAPTTQATTSAVARPSDSADVVELSPFQVNTAKDTGYVAENSLAGSRINTKLRDTPGSVSVFTKEFLDDLAIGDIKQLTEYTVNTEVDTQARVAGTGQNAFINAQNLNGNILTRGISASQGLDLFVAIGPGDGYRIGRYDDSRGPNSILFGIAAVGGIINQTSKTARTDRDAGTLRYGFGSWARSRVEFDANLVLAKKKLAFLVAAVDQKNAGWRNFDFNDKKRIYASIVARPTARLTLTAMGETGRDFLAIMRSGIEAEEMLAWYDNRAARGVDAVTVTPTTALPAAAQIALGVTGRNGASGGLNHRLTLIENSGQFFDAIGTYLSGTYNNAAVRSPDGLAGRTGGTLRLSDPRLYPYFNNASGPGMDRVQGVTNHTLSADYRLARNLHFNLAHNYQQTRAVLHLMVNASPVLRGDPNRTLGLNGPANPFAGRLYFDGDWRRDIHDRDYRETRASLSYAFEPKPRWLGRHQAVALVSRSRDFDTRANSWLVLAGRPFSTDAQNANNRLLVRNYLTEGNYATYRVGDWRSLPRQITFLGQTYGTAYANDAASGTNAGAIQNTDAMLAALQSHFWHDRIVTTLGAREDRATLTQLGYANDPVIGDIVDFDPAKRTSNSFQGRTHSAGLVVHVTDWLSLLANRSNNSGIPSFNRTVFPDGKLAPAPKGEGRDLGLGLDLFGGKVTAKLAYFESSEVGASGANGAAAMVARNLRVLDAFASVLAVPGGPYTPAQWQTLTRPLNPNVTGNLSDFVSSGYEARITANLTRNWRLLFNYSYTDSSRAHLHDETIAWYGFKKDAAGLAIPGASQNAAGQWIVDPAAYLPGGTLAKWLEFAAQRPGAALGTLTTSSSITVAQEIYNLATSDINDSKLDFEKRWGLRPHKLSVFTAYDFKEGRLRGFSTGAGWRWRSANIIGTDTTSREIKGRPLSYIDLMLRYATKFKSLPGTVNFQVNVSNAFNNADPVPTRLLTNDLSYQLPGGRGTPYGRLDLVDPREVRFTTTYSF
jgi:outer membrane receptor protein involved in Fe transport